METQVSSANNYVMINNGLLTEINGKIATIGYEYTDQKNQKANKKIVSSNITSYDKDTLINYINYKKQTTKLSPRLLLIKEIKSFYPIIFKENNNKFHDLGLFKYKRHQEAIEAMRQNKAFYCLAGQGAIVYNINKQPDPNNAIYKHLIDDITEDTRIEPLIIMPYLESYYCSQH